MKLRFQINYRTLWGETLQVTISYSYDDGTLRQAALLMNTNDGDLWTLETAVVESRQKRVESFTYFYSVVDNESTELRREWTLLERTYAFDATHTFNFVDSWRDLPLHHYLYTLAYQHTSCSTISVGDKVRPLRQPLYRRTIIFRVSAPQIDSGQSVALVGNHPAVGAWSAARYLLMQPIGLGDWMLSVNVAALNEPLEYKFVVIDNKTHELIHWEEGDNRLIETQMSDGEVRVAYGESLRLGDKSWRIAGVVVPVFSLRSQHSCGVGDFGDLRRLVDWAITTGMKIIQLLPLNDTTTDGSWANSYPYNITSAFALHPHYMDLEQLGDLSEHHLMTVYHRQQRELNALPFSDYEAVERVKHIYMYQTFVERGRIVLCSDDYLRWAEANRWWLTDYARWSLEQSGIHSIIHPSSSTNGDTELKSISADEYLEYIGYIQYNLHLQLKAVTDYARQNGVVIKGDVPIGVNRQSVECALHPDLFHLDTQTGAPPDSGAPLGQNWGFPTYNWDNPALISWLQRRLTWMEQYFDAIRIDHVLAFFRIWEIPEHAVYATLGHFSPALPLSPDEIAFFGLTFRRELLTQPFINDAVLSRLFGIHAEYVRNNFLTPKSYGLYEFRPDYDTQKKVMSAFDGRTDENSLWIRDGLLQLLASVLFVEDARQPGMYHPRIQGWQEPVFNALSSSERDAYQRLYNNYYYERHNHFWGQRAYKLLMQVFKSTRLLVCAEDLGMLPRCVDPVLDSLRILTLQVQSLPKQQGYEFAHLEAYPYRSVATPTTHDMSPLRLWWQESPDRTQRYYSTMLQKQGRAPEQLPAHLAEEIIARHIYCPSMICLLSLQDWLAMDAELRARQPRDERINTPSDPYNHWQWRMHLTIEQLLSAERFNAKIQTMIKRSKR